eukprot:1657493-Pyramimonas_sp.AAC.1
MGQTSEPEGCGWSAAPHRLEEVALDTGVVLALHHKRLHVTRGGHGGRARGAADSAWGPDSQTVRGSTVRGSTVRSRQREMVVGRHPKAGTRICK